MRDRQRPAPPDKIVSFSIRDGVKMPTRECVPGTRVKTSPIYSPEAFEDLMRRMWERNPPS